MKVCSCCKFQLPFSDFYKDKKTKDGMYSRCKKCHLETTSKWSKANHLKVAELARKRRAAEPEKSRAYSNMKAAEAYQKDPQKHRERAAAYRAKNPEKANASTYAAKAKKPEAVAGYLSQYYQENSESIKARSKARGERLKVELRPYNNERVMRRNARKIRACPPWANIDAIKAIYAQAAVATAASGIPHHVDHIVPLQSKRVCGLHVEMNLQILPGSENQSKSNRWWPDAP